LPPPEPSPFFPAYLLQLQVPCFACLLRTSASCAVRTCMLAPNKQCMDAVMCLR
jgi:hypothetical protein